MSDITVPSWRPRPDSGRISWRMLAIAGGVLGCAALAGAVAWGVSRMGPRPVPVIEADARPLKVRPEAAGGMTVPNQDQLVLEPPAVRRAAERSQGAAARLDTGPEAPALDELRQQAAPPVALLRPAAPGTAPADPVPQGVPPMAAALPAPVAPPSSPLPAAVPAQPAASAGLAPTAGGRAQVQFAALASEEAARAEWTRLARRVPELAAFQPRVTRLEREGQPPLFRLRTGGLGDAAAARALCDAVRARGASCVSVGS